MKNKEWTVLIYANGSNELEPEIWRSKLNLEKKCNSKNINVIMQISRAPQKLVNIIRNISEDNKVNDNEERWDGVRRYLLKDNKSKLLEDMKTINMASHKTLFDFIKWGVKNYPAKKYMLIISGHGFLVATLSDICGVEPYTLGIYEMCTAINNINKSLKANIDLLILDICNMNNIELIYELGKEVNNTVKNILTYIDSGPLIGMPYEKIIDLLEVDNGKDIKELVSKIIKEIDLETIGIQVNHQKLKKIKFCLNKLGYYKIIKKKDLKYYDEEDEKKYLKELSKEILSMIIDYNTIKKGKFPIRVITPEMYDIENVDLFLKYYNKLAITKNNYWANVVANKSIDEPLNLKISKVEQNVLTKENLFAFISLFNEKDTDEEVIIKVKKLYRYCKWR